MDARFQSALGTGRGMRPRQPGDVLSAIGLGDASTVIRELPPGLTHRRYRFELDGRPQVLRLDTPDAARLGLDRSVEFRVQARAAEAGLAAPVRYADPAAGILVYEYLPGRALTRGDLDDPRRLAAIGETLAAVHALPQCGTTLSLAGAADRYAAIVAGEPALRESADRCLGIVAAAPARDRSSCCHNDVVAGNCVEDGRLRLIDWEYAADNEPLFDLASLIGYHDLDERAAGILLSAHGGADGEARARLAIERRLFDAIQWLWLAAQAVLDPAAARRDRLATLSARLP